MLIKFSELPILFGRLALGTVLIDTEGNRYLKIFFLALVCRMI